MRLYGYAGPAGSGKDTCGAILIEKLGFERVSFATPLYKALDGMGFGWPKTQAEKEAVIPWLGKSWRELAQTLGTEWGRQMVHDDLWVTLALRGLDPKGSYVITDVRFENEATAIRVAGGKVVHLMNRKAEGVRDHVSEKSLYRDEKDYTLDNGVGTRLGTLETILLNMVRFDDSQN